MCRARRVLFSAALANGRSRCATRCAPRESWSATGAMRPLGAYALRWEPASRRAGCWPPWRGSGMAISATAGSKPILVFDMDGVLVDVTDSYRETIARTVQHFTGTEVTRSQIQEYKNQGGWNDDWRLSHHMVRSAGVDVPFEDVRAHFQQIFRGNGTDGLMLRERWVARPGVLETMNEEFRFAVFTGRPKEEAELTLARFAPGVVFDPLIAMEDV